LASGRPFLIEVSRRCHGRHGARARQRQREDLNIANVTESAILDLVFRATKCRDFDGAARMVLSSIMEANHSSTASR
jgi:hypothetical protein